MPYDTNIFSLADCNIGTIIQGTSHPVRVSGSGGAAPYTFYWKLDSGSWQSYTGTASEVYHDFGHIWNESTGSHTVTVKVSYVCNGVTYASSETNCTVTINPAITTGSVRFHTSPGGVDIWQGATKLGTTDSNGTLLVPNLPIGPLSYVAKRIGYYDSSTQNITVIGNTTIDAPLVILIQKIGSVNISSSPSGAKIYIDGTEQIGRLTPTTISGLSQSPPNHTYKLMLTGYEDAIGTFDIIADQTTIIPTIVLTPTSPITGTVIILSNPSGAKIYIDGIEQIGRLTPSTVANIAPSPPSHTYKLTLTGYNDKSDSFDISPGEIKMIDVGNLTPIVAQAGFSPAGMILMAGLVVGVIYNEVRKKDKAKAKTM